MNEPILIFQKSGLSLEISIKLEKSINFSAKQAQKCFAKWIKLK